LAEKKKLEQDSEGRQREGLNRQKLIQENVDQLWDELADLLSTDVDEFNELRGVPQHRLVTFHKLPHKEIEIGTPICRFVHCL